MKRPKDKWRYEGLACVAYTRSEARAIFKSILGLPRLPVGADVVKREG